MKKKIMQIRKAIIPVAGLGTRMLPATKAIPKELLPILDKPLIQYVVEEAISAGIKEIILVTRPGKEALENHFDVNFELEYFLERKGKKKILKSIKNVIPKNIKISSVKQDRALGLGHAILCASHLVDMGEPFAVLLPDEFLLKTSSLSDFSQMIENFKREKKSQILVEKIKLSETHQYGIVNLNNKRFNKSNYLEISGFVEKPPTHKAPSNYRIVGRYILPYEVFSIIKKLPLGKDGEIQLTDSLNILVENKKKNFEAFLSKAKIFDCGTKKGFIGANIAMAKKDKEIFNYVRQILKN